MPDRKYEADGGPSFAAISGIIRQHVMAPLEDIEALMRAALFNLLVGNCDAHGKNILPALWRIGYKSRSFLRSRLDEGLS